jgi:hypothetical protein
MSDESGPDSPSSHKHKKRSKSHSSAHKKKRNEVHGSPERTGYMWCHQCKQKHVQVIYCSKPCSKKYCVRCVERHYRGKIEEIDQSDWICYYCQGICSCAFCRRRRAKETNTKFESHRGKKRRITVDSDEHHYHRKRKSTSYESEDLTPKEKRNKHDWIVEDYDKPNRFHKLPKRLNKSKPPKRLRITLKDLLDTEILFPDDELLFHDTEQALLLPDGQIQYNHKTYRTLYGYIKQASLSLGLPSDSLSSNSWRLVYCRGKVLNLYRQQYLKITDSKYTYLEDDEEDEEEFEEKEDNEEGRGSSNSRDEEGDDEDLRGTTEDSTGKDEPEPDSGKDSRILNPDTGIECHETWETTPENKPDSNEINLSWWLEDEDEVHSPLHQLLLDDIYLFSGTSPTFESDDEKDLLVLGNNYKVFVEIDDKDFFNISCNDETTYLPIREETSYMKFPSSGESVEDFYNVSVGIDTY